MITLKSILKISIFGVMLVAAASLGQFALAQDTLLISYQGMLTDALGEPVTGSPAISFTIYTVGGVSKWAEGHSSVPVNDGLFSVILGSQAALPDSVFSGDDRYLGISVEGDGEISPRTLLTSSPGAAVSRRVVGDIQTAPGRVFVENSSGDTAVVMAADPGVHAMRLHPPDPCVPPDPCEPALELVAEPDNHIFRVHPPEPCVPPEPCGPAFEVKAESDSTKVTISSGGDSGPAARIYTNGATHQAYFYVHVDDIDNEPSGDSGPALLASVGRDESSITTSWWDQISGDSSRAYMGSDTSGAFAEVHSTKDAGGHTAVAMAADDVLAQLTLLNGDPAGPADVVIRALPDGGGQIGVNTESPAEALDVNGTTQTTAFKMPTGAVDGHVLTSDGDGNGTWQPPGTGSYKASCADMYEGMTNSSSQITITFPVTFDAAPYFSVTGLFRSDSHAGKMAHVVVSTLTTTGVTVTIQYWNGAIFTGVGDSVELLLSYTAIEK